MVSVGNNLTSNEVVKTQNLIRNKALIQHSPASSETLEKHSPVNNQTPRHGETGGAQNVAVQLTRGTVSVIFVTKNLIKIKPDREPDSSGVGKKGPQGGRRLEAVGTRGRVRTHTTGSEQTPSQGTGRVRARRTQPNLSPAIAAGNVGSPQGPRHSREQGLTRGNRRQAGTHNRPNITVSGRLLEDSHRENSRATLNRPMRVKRI